MYNSLLFFHSLTRWLVLVSLVYSIYGAGKGLLTNAMFSKLDNAFRHWTATIAHIQLVLGVILYIKSPIVHFYYSNYTVAKSNGETSFFGSIHAVLMFFSVVLLTIGSALAKRKAGDRAKFRTMLLWFSMALALIFIAIPWPFSPFANRPYFRNL